MMRKLILTALSTAVMTSLVQAQNTQPVTPAQAGTATTAPAAGASTARAAVSDPLFAAAAAASGLAEVTISQMGAERATDPELKRFSQQMIEEHSRANAELMALAGQKGIALPRSLDPRAQFCGQSLATLTGKDFDTCYAKAQLVNHMEAVEAFTAEAERGQDPQVKAWAAKMLPHIKGHLKAIQPIAQKAEQAKPSTEGAAEHNEK